MSKVFSEIHRVLKPGKVLGLYVSDSYEHNRAGGASREGKGKFYALGFELFGLMQKQGFEPIDIISVIRHNKTLEMGNYRKAAEEGNYFLRGFNYLFIMKKG